MCWACLYLRLCRSGLVLTHAVDFALGRIADMWRLNTFLPFLLLSCLQPRVSSQTRRGDPVNSQVDNHDPDFDGREVSQMRFWRPFTPSDRLLLPDNWSWNNYKANLLEKDSREWSRPTIWHHRACMLICTSLHSLCCDPGAAKHQPSR